MSCYFMIDNNNPLAKIILGIQVKWGTDRI